MTKFTKQLKQTRKQLGVSQSGAAKLIPGLSVRTLQSWEAGSEPPKYVQTLVLEAMNKAAA